MGLAGDAGAYSVLTKTWQQMYVGNATGKVDPYS